MKNHFRSAVIWVLSVSLLLNLPLPVASQEAQKSKAVTWTLGEALAQLELYPQDAYLQYVALQLARRENKTDETAPKIEKLLFGESSFGGNAERRNRVDLFGIFTGALAVQESLQLDTMRGEVAGVTPPAIELPPTPTTPQVAPPTQNGNEEPTAVPTPKKATNRSARRRAVKSKSVSSAKSRKAAVEAAPVEAAIPTPEKTDADEQRQIQEAQKNARQAQVAAIEQRRKEIVPIANLTGPTVQSHPWEKMLAGRKPEISPLANFIPEDFYFVEFRSLNKLLEAVETSDLWGTHFLNQSFREARTHNFGERLKRQLALETTAISRSFYDLVVEDLAITGSDLFVREGTDVSLIFRLKKPEVFRTQMDGFLSKAEKARPDVKRLTGTYLGVDYVQLVSPERDISAISAYPKPDVCVRTNSLAALQRILAAMQGQAKALGATKEMAYIRTLMPRGAQEEDGFVYLSDPFIRRLVGPQLKITERRRMLCYNNLRMIAHASLLYQTEQGKKPTSLAALAEDKCSPGTFGEGLLVCPDGGTYSLAADGNTGVCSHHGQAQFLTPNLEIPVTQANGEEADEYKRFLEEYNQYWRVFFDPIALRLKLTDKQYRLETVVLPLIDNSIYSGMALAFGGKPEPLDALPVPKRNIFSLGVRLNKEKLLEELNQSAAKAQAESFSKDLGVNVDQKSQEQILELLTKGFGNQIGLHIYDAPPTFDLNLPALMGMLMGTTLRPGRSSGFGDFLGLAIGFGVAMLNTPVYASLPIKDAAVVDRFLKENEALVAAGARKLQRGNSLFGIETDYFSYPNPAEKNSEAPLIQAFALRFGPVKFRIFSARIGNGFYVASKPFILEDIYALEKAGVKGNADAIGHAMVRVRASNWNQVLPDYRLAWAENQREACLNNLGVLSSTGRAYLAQNKDALSDETTGRAIHQYANQMHAVGFFCPEGGSYLLSADGKTIKCSVHGNALTPRQPPTPLQNSSLDKLMNNFSGATATLEFTEDGLRAVVNIDRK